jgi:membrane fusion protein (multidrug efflux system)
MCYSLRHVLKRRRIGNYDRIREGPIVDRIEGNEAMTTPTESTNGAPAWRKMLFLAVLLIVLIVGGVLGLHYWQYATSHAATDDASLSSDLVQIAPQISGTVAQVLVRDNQPVRAGELLVVLDDSTARTAVAQAQANLQMAIAQAQGAGVNVSLTADTGGAQIMQAQGGVQQADSGIASARADLDRATAAIANAEAGEKSASANVGTVQAAQRAATANIGTLQAAQRTATTNIGTVQAAQKAAAANVGSAQAGLKAAEANIQKAKAAVAGAQAQVTTAQAGVRTAQANADAVHESLENADRDAQRYADYVPKGR